MNFTLGKVTRHNSIPYLRVGQFWTCRTDYIQRCYQWKRLNYCMGLNYGWASCFPVSWRLCQWWKTGEVRGELGSRQGVVWVATCWVGFLKGCIKPNVPVLWWDFPEQKVLTRRLWQGKSGNKNKILVMLDKCRYGRKLTWTALREHIFNIFERFLLSSLNPYTGSQNYSSAPLISAVCPFCL